MRLSPFSHFNFILFLREANSVYNLGQYKATYFYAKGCKTQVYFLLSYLSEALFALALAFKMEW